MTRLFAGDSFWTDWETVPLDIRHSFRQFLDKLKSNPFDPAVMESAQIDRRSRYAFEFAPGWIVIWRPNTAQHHVVPFDLDSTDIQLFAIGRKG